MDPAELLSAFTSAGIDGDEEGGDIIEYYTTQFWEQLPLPVQHFYEEGSSIMESSEYSPFQTCIELGRAAHHSGFFDWFVQWQWERICHMREAFCDSLIVMSQPAPFFVGFSLYVLPRFFGDEVEDTLDASINQILSFLPESISSFMLTQYVEHLRFVKGKKAPIGWKLSWSLKRLLFPLTGFFLPLFTIQKIYGDSSFQNMSINKKTLYISLLLLPFGIALAQGYLSAFRCFKILTPTTTTLSTSISLPPHLSHILETEEDFEDELEQGAPLIFSADTEMLLLNSLGSRLSPIISRKSLQRIQRILGHAMHLYVISLHFGPLLKAQGGGKYISGWIWSLALATYLITFPRVSRSALHS